MGKTEVENLDLKSKLNIVSSTIANAKKDIESFKTEINNLFNVTKSILVLPTFQLIQQSLSRTIC